MMNDFTKNELEYIAEAIEMWFKDYDSDTPERIYFKVKSMIDNYCEHDWRKGVHLFNDVYCTKCKKHFEVNNEISQ